VGPIPHFGTTLETTFSPLLFGKFHENPFSRSRERVSGIFLTDGKKKKTKKTEKTSVTHICIRLIGGCVNNDSHPLNHDVIYIVCSDRKGYAQFMAHEMNQMQQQYKRS